MATRDERQTFKAFQTKSQSKEKLLLNVNTLMSRRKISRAMFDQ